MEVSLIIWKMYMNWGNKQKFSLLRYLPLVRKNVWELENKEKFALL